MGSLNCMTCCVVAAAVFVATLPVYQSQSQLSQLFASQPYFRGIVSLLKGHRSREFVEQVVKDTKNEDFNPVVQIGDGSLRGFTLKTISGHAISAFQSIPFAQPPVGPLRFRDPVKNLPWEGVRNAIVRSPQCIQVDLVELLWVHGQEDCLYLNVYTPRKRSSSKQLPVMVWFHGGFFYFGAGSIYGPRYLLDNQNVILVTFNYRLGPFGFLSTGDDASPGNQGLKDQLLALKWVQENIAAFGGDPNSVTIFGESAGATSVGLHIASPASRGLFQRAIAQSGSAFCLMDQFSDAPATADKVAEMFKCRSKSSEEMVECLRNVPEKLLAPVQLQFRKWLIFPMLWFGPTVEHNHTGAFLTKHPRQYYEDGEAANVSLITGLTADEMSLFVSILYKVPIFLKEVNTDWDRVGPSVLNLNRNQSEVANVEKVRQAWKFYMGDRKLNWETRLDGSRMLSDQYFTECTLEAMRYHSMYTNQSVYGYHFSYHGRYSTVQQVGGRPQNWGVAHSDELIYLLNNPHYYPSLKPGDPEKKMSEMMTSMWTNFAAFDKPCMSNNNNESCFWSPIEPAKNIFSPLQFLNLTLYPNMIEDPYVERYNFWHLNDTQNF